MRLVVVVGVTAVFVAALVMVASGIAGGDAPVAEGPVPRVCWFSDYENAKLSNKCEFNAVERRWYMEVDGRLEPADEQELPAANLCHYFYGLECPTGRDER